MAKKRLLKYLFEVKTVCVLLDQTFLMVRPSGKFLSFALSQGKKYKRLSINSRDSSPLLKIVFTYNRAKVKIQSGKVPNFV